jgi:hypothetical protein
MSDSLKSKPKTKRVQSTQPPRHNVIPQNSIKLSGTSAETFTSDALIHIQNRHRLHATTVAPGIAIRRSRASRIYPMEHTVHTVVARRYLGVHTQSRTKEEDVAFEEEASANGRKGSGGRDGALQVPCLRANQEDALSLPTLLRK